jgi:endogenous inhibitor of DNA gyrase (YacG/DUF329 family)
MPNLPDKKKIAPCPHCQKVLNAGEIKGLLSLLPPIARTMSARQKTELVASIATNCPRCGAHISYRELMSLRGARMSESRATKSGGKGHPAKKLYCWVCNAGPMGVVEIRQHFAVHGPPPYPCPRCGVGFGALEIRYHLKICKAERALIPANP